MFNYNSFVFLILHPTTPSAPHMQSTGASKTVVTRNFFKQAGEVVDVRYEDGPYKGACYIEFATEEATRKASKLDGQYLCNREIVVESLVESTTTGASKTLAAKNLSVSTNKSWPFRGLPKTNLGLLL
ncbi:hypothetical protein MKX01_033412 [Papaver californicum]|nr:hypothetical protein MKX01_033412 [Papaver californicum]